MSRRTIIRWSALLGALLLVGLLIRPADATQAPFEFDDVPAPATSADIITALDWIKLNSTNAPPQNVPELLAIGSRDELVRIVPSDGLSSNFPNLLEGSAIDLTDSLGTSALAWTVEGDLLAGGFLLLGVARTNEPDLVFRINFAPDIFAIAATEIWRSPVANSTSLAWADLNNDGRRDLLIGTDPGGVLVYTAGGDLPAGRTWTLSQTIAPATNVQSLSLTSSTGAGAPDLLAVGVSDAGVGARSAVYRLDATGVVEPPIWQDSVAGPVVDIAWGNANPDSRPDLFVSSYGDTDRVYLANSPGAPFALPRTPTWISPVKHRTLATVVGDVDGDGLDDLFSLRYQENAAGTPQAVGALARSSVANDVFRLVPQDWAPAPTPAEANQTLGAAILADYSRDGARDLLYSVDIDRTPGFGVAFWRNLRLTAFELQVRDPANKAQPGAFIFRKRDAQPLYEPYRDPRTSRLLTTDSDGILYLRDDLRAGDKLIAMAPVLSGGATTVRAAAATGLPLAITDNGVVTATLDIADEGRIQDLRIEQLGLDHTFLGDLRITLISPAGTDVTLLNQECGRNAEITSINLTVSNEVSNQACPIQNGSTIAPDEPLGLFVGEELRGRWHLVIADLSPRDTGTLRSWQLVARVADSSLYYTNAEVRTDGTVGEGFTAGNVLEPQFINVSPDNPLLLFNLDVSLEWDARNDVGFLQQLRFDLTRAAELLYDLTDGQATVLQYTIYHDRERWNSADIRVHASNRLRPNADQGGVTAQPRADAANAQVIYVPGQIRMGSLWNRYGAAVGTAGEDWPRALAHELGHYLFYLDDNYLGIDTEGRVFGIPTAEQLNTPCRGAMFDPYRNDESELQPGDGWDLRCGLTFSQFYTQRPDWETIRAFYPALRAPQTYNANPGPETLPFALPLISEQLPSAPTTTLVQNVFNTISAAGGRLLPTAGSRAILYHGNRAVDLGSPLLDRVEARGARPGDELCVYDWERLQIGCSNISPANSRIVMLDVPNWRPDVRLRPLSGTRIEVELRAEGTGLTDELVEARFYPSDQDAIFAATLTRTGDRYLGVIDVTGRNRPVQQGLLRVLVAAAQTNPGNPPTPRREAIVDYIQHGVPELGPPPVFNEQVADLSDPSVQQLPCGRAGLPPCPTPKPRPAPASSDGQATLYGSTAGLRPGDFFTFQAASELPEPLPPWSEPVGVGYWLNGTVGVGERLNTTSFNAAYLERELPPGTQGGLGIFYWNRQTWERLPLTRVDRLRNEVTARTRGLGLYALLTTLAPQQGWNVISYPWQPEDQSVAAALARLNADETHYTTVYGYDDATGRWRIYDNRLGEWAGLVNTLQRLDYGRGYWVNVTAAGAASSRFAPPDATPVARAASMPTPVIQLTQTPSATPTTTPRPITGTGLPTPPATYYGELVPGVGVTPASGLRVEALINGRVCGETTTQPYNGRIAFVVQVEGDTAGFNGCGGESRVITWRVDGKILPNITVWDNTRPYLLTLNGDHRIWFPLTGLLVPAPSPCVAPCLTE